MYLCNLHQNKNKIWPSFFEVHGFKLDIAYSAFVPCQLLGSLLQIQQCFTGEPTVEQDVIGYVKLDFDLAAPSL